MLQRASFVSLLLMLLGSAVHAQPRDWVLLGQQNVGFGTDRDVININQTEDWYRNRSFRSLHFMPERNDVHMMSVRVVYMNGFAEDFRIDRLIPQGRDFELDLRGDRSFIRQIEMTYRSRPDFRGQAVMRVFGEPARSAPPPPPPVAGNWVLLGQQTVGAGVDRDVINVNQTEDWYRNRSFRSLHFMAERSDVYMMSVRIVYMNGFDEDFRVDQLIQQGRDFELDLRGDRSFIRQIEMVYRARQDRRGQAVVSVYGEPARRGPPTDLPTGTVGWVELGCQQVNLVGRDRDIIQVGRREGRFKSIRLAVRGSDVEMLDLKVVYANGQPDDLPVRNLIRAGERTRPLDLQGWERAIDRIELTYRSVLNPVNIITQQGLRTATVCVEGQR